MFTNIRQKEARIPREVEEQEACYLAAMREGEVVA